MSCNNAVFVELLEFLLSELAKNANISTTRTYIQCLGGITYVEWLTCFVTISVVCFSTAAIVFIDSSFYKHVYFLYSNAHVFYKFHKLSLFIS